jgi:lysophospholipase L1-like esterase
MRHCRNLRIVACSAIVSSLVLPAANPSAQEKPSLGRVVFLGDSITEAGDQPNGYVALFREFVLKSGKATEVIGAGVSGNKVPDLEARLDRDVLAHKPDTVVIYIGINDVWHSLQGNGTPTERFREGLRSVVDRIQAGGARAVICTPSVIGERAAGTNDLDGKLDEYAQLSRTVARETDSQLIDLRKEFFDYLATANPDNKAEGVLTTDGVHLNANGNAFVARVIQSALCEQPATRRLRHVVLIKFKADLPLEQIDETLDEFAKLKDKIDVVLDFESGKDVSNEQLSQGYTHGFVLTFADEQARDAYLAHEAHEEFKKLAIPRVESVLVFDFVAVKEKAAK